MTYIPRAGTWRLHRKLSDGHRLFISDDTSHGLLYAIADDSGSSPERTDDGVLLLDQSRPLYVGYDESFTPRRQHCAIPLRNAAGEATSTPTDAATILRLAAAFHWQVNVVDMAATQYEVKGINR